MNRPLPNCPDQDRPEQDQPEQDRPEQDRPAQESGSPALFLQGRTVRLLLSALAGIAVGIVLLKSGRIPLDLPVPQGWAATGVAALLAALTALGLGLRGLWPLGAALGPPFAAIALLADLPGWVFPVFIAVLAGLFWNVRSERVPLYLSNLTTQRALADLIAGVDGAPQGRIIDLGCGFGQTTLTLASRFPEAQVIGVETAPLVFAIAWLRAKLTAPGNVKISYRTLWREDLGQYDAVYCFLSTEPMARLIAKARTEMRPGTVLVSNTFTDPGYTSDEIVLVGDSRETQLHVWRL